MAHWWVPHDAVWAETVWAQATVVWSEEGRCWVRKRYPGGRERAIAPPAAAFTKSRRESALGLLVTAYGRE